MILPMGLFSNRLGDPVPGLSTLSGVALLVMAKLTSLGSAVGFACRYLAASPATCAAAIAVPVLVVVAVSSEIAAVGMSCPGANTSNTDPKFDVLTRPSIVFVPPTVIAAATLAGDFVPAPTFMSPAASA